MIIKIKENLVLFGIISFTLFFLTSFTHKRKPTFEPGIYTFVKPSIIQVNLLQLKYDSRFLPVSVMLLNFMEDSTYHVSYCNKLIRESGKWYFANDSVHFTNRMLYPDKKQISDKTSLVNKKGIVFYASYYSTDSTHKNIETTMLKLNGKDYDTAYQREYWAK